VAASKVVWVGRGLAVLITLLLLFSAAMKFVNNADVKEGIAHLGIPERMLIPLGILEAACAILYLIRPVAVLGTVLLTGYLGGAICTHWRVGDPFWPQIILALFVWLAMYLREPRLKEVLPVRR
jgi:DoxX-like protein